MSVIEALSKRYSCRKFKSDELPGTLLSDLLVAAQKTASWCNTQPWSVHILSGDARGKVALVVSRGGKMLNLTADFGSQAGPAKPAKKKKAKLY